MGILLTLALWLHLAALGVGGAATFGIPALGMVAKTATPEGRAALGAVAVRLSFMGRFAIGLLIATGAVMIGAAHGVTGLGVWFWVKMILVAGFVALIVISTRNGARARAGDAEAVARAPGLAMIGIGFFLAIVLAAVAAFH